MTKKPKKYKRIKDKDMGVLFDQLKAEVDVLYSYRTLQDWKDQSIYRDVIQRSQKDFDWLKSMYPKKITRLAEMLTNSTDKEEQAFLTAKIARIKDKFAAVCMEEKMRADGDVVRTGLHDQTDYYLDYDNGNDGSAGTATGTAWKTLSKYTTTTVRTPGDRLFVRANITWDQGTEATDIIFDEDGTADNYISIIGCDSVTNDPWGDASDVLPIVDFEDAAYQFNIGGDDFWYLERVDIRQGNDGNGLLTHSTAYGTYIKSCVFRDCNATSVEGIRYIHGNATLDSCTFVDCNGSSIAVNAGQIHIKSCTFNGGGDVSTNNAVQANGGVAYIEDSTFGDTTAFDSSDILAQIGGTVYLRNCTRSTSMTVTGGASVFIEDNDATFESHIASYTQGTITRDTGTVRVGGADSSAKMEPTDECGPNLPLVLGHPITGFAQVWVAAGSYTATVYASVGSAWDSALTAAECYMVTSELDNAGTAARVTRQSAQQIDNDTTWTAFTTSISPAREGFVYFWFYLEEYEDATEHIFVDIKPTVV
jgi:hypothetical protein